MCSLLEMCSPLTEERLTQLENGAQEFMQTFGKEYMKMYALAMLQRIQEEVEGGEDNRKLTYRDWKSVERPDMFAGECYMQTGEGAGAFGGWKKVFLTEMSDYNLAVYKDEKEYKAKKKPQKVIRTAGYTVQRDPQHHYRTELYSLAGNMGFSSAEVDALVQFSRYSWALSHSWRTNYVFQLKKGSGGCGCFGGNAVEPDDIDESKERRRHEFVRVFERSVVYSGARDTDSITGRAFDLTVAKMTEKCQNLSNFSDDGLEAEILVDMLLEECLAPMRDEMLSEIVAPNSLKFVLWYKTRGVIQKTLQGVCNPAWGATQKAAQSLGEKIEPKLKTGLEPILKAKEGLKDKIREKIIDEMGSFLQRYVTPYIDPILKAFDQPMTKAFDQSRCVYVQNVVISNLPDDEKKRNLFLDAIPRTSSIMCEVSYAADSLMAPIEALISVSGDIFADVNPQELRDAAEMSVLETLDAAIYTTELKISEEGKQDPIKDRVLKDYDHDVVIARCDFVKETVRSILLAAFKKAMEPVVSPILEAVDGTIPEDLQDFISAAGLYEEIVDLFVGEPIDQMVEKAYPTPK